LATDQADQAAIAEATQAFRPPARQGERRLARRKRAAAYGMLTPGALYLLLFFIVPMLLIVVTSLQRGGVFSGGFTMDWGNPAFGNYPEGLSRFGEQYLRSLLWAAVATAICICLAYPMAYWIAFYAGRWKATLFLLILVPFFVSFIIRTVMWNFILSDNGLLFSWLASIGLLPDDFRVLKTPVATIAGLSYNFIPFTALPLYVALERIDKRLIEAAKDLYATKAEAFRKVVLPLSYPGVFAAVILTFVPMTGDYVNNEILGPTDKKMIGQIIQQEFLTSKNYPLAAALSVMLMIGMLVIALLYARALGTEDSTLAAA
jgi:spermidine/putrescine transport system permease protein